MDTQKITGSLKATPTESLLDLLSLTDSSIIDPDYLSMVINELSARELTPEQSTLFNGLLEKYAVGGMIHVTGQDISFEHIRVIEPGRHATLKTLVTPLVFFGVMVILFGLVGFIENVGKDLVLNGFFIISLCTGIGLLMIAISGLIKGFIEMEYSARKRQKQ